MAENLKNCFLLSCRNLDNCQYKENSEKVKSEVDNFNLKDTLFNIINKQGAADAAWAKCAHYSLN